MASFARCARNAPTLRSRQPRQGLKGIISMLKAGDMVDIVAPSYGCAEEVLAGSIRYLARWQLRARTATDIFGQDPICAASDSVRFRALRDALYASDSQCV